MDMGKLKVLAAVIFVAIVILSVGAAIEMHTFTQSMLIAAFIIVVGVLAGAVVPLIYFGICWMKGVDEEIEYLEEEVRDIRVKV